MLTYAVLMGSSPVARTHFVFFAFLHHEFIIYGSIKAKSLPVEQFQAL